MSQDPRSPYSTGSFPRDDAHEGQTETAGGAPHAADPGLADQPPGGPARQPAWGQSGGGGTASAFPRDGAPDGDPSAHGTDSALTPDGGGAAQAVDPGLADQEPEGPAHQPAWGRSGGGTASTLPRDGAPDGEPSEQRTDSAMTPAGGGAPQAVDPGLADQEPEAPAAMGASTQTAAEEPALDRFRERWPSIQGAFVDDPKAAVAEADRLVAEVIREVEQRLTRRREQIQSQQTGGEPDTEQLRQHIHGYRALFQRLLEHEL